MVSGFLKAYSPIETEIKMKSTLLPGIDNHRNFFKESPDIPWSMIFLTLTQTSQYFHTTSVSHSGQVYYTIRDKKILQILGLTITH